MGQTKDAIPIVTANRASWISSWEMQIGMKAFPPGCHDASLVLGRSWRLFRVRRETKQPRRPLGSADGYLIADCPTARKSAARISGARDSSSCLTVHVGEELAPSMAWVSQHTQLDRPRRLTESQVWAARQRPDGRPSHAGSPVWQVDGGESRYRLLRWQLSGDHMRPLRAEKHLGPGVAGRLGFEVS
jgi:hypothetical protein